MYISERSFMQHLYYAIFHTDVNKAIRCKSQGQTPKRSKSWL